MGHFQWATSSFLAWILLGLWISSARAELPYSNPVKEHLNANVQQKVQLDIDNVESEVTGNPAVAVVSRSSSTDKNSNVFNDKTGSLSIVDDFGPWIAVAAIVIKFCAIAKVAVILIWGWVMNELGIGTKEFHDEYFRLTTTTTEKAIIYGPSYPYGAPATAPYGNVIVAGNVYGPDDLLPDTARMQNPRNIHNTVVQQILDYIYLAFLELGKILKNKLEISIA